MISAVVLLCLLAGTGFTLNNAVLDRTDEGCIQVADFYKLDKNTVDVLWIGSSHVYHSINTCMMYDDYGMACYLLASPGQPVWMSYYFLEEALKTQAPKLVVFDVCTVFHREADAGASSWPALISMKPSRTKWDMIQAVNSSGRQLDPLSAFFSFPYYHTRYSDLKKKDYENTKEYRFHGYKPVFDHITESELAEWKDAEILDFDEMEPLPERAETYLWKIAELCRKKDIELLLVNAPYINKSVEKQKAYNYIRKAAKERDIPFIDGNYAEGLDIDYAQDMLEASHLNYYGGQKYTKYLAQWIKEHYDIPDRRGEERYWAWEKASRLFQHAVLKPKELEQIKTMPEYMEAVQELDECVVVTYETPNGETVVYDHGRPVFKGEAGQSYFRHFDLGSGDLAVDSRDGRVKVRVDKRQYAHVYNGQNILVYDKIAKRVIGSAGFDEEKNEGCVNRRVKAYRRRKRVE